MSTDDRDPRLGDLLDRAVRQIEPEEVATEVIRRGSRRRAGTVVAAMTAAALFVAGVGFAATQVGRDAGPRPVTPGGWTTLAAPDIPWTMPVPPGWRAGASRTVGGPMHVLQDVRFSFVANAATGIPRGAPSFGAPLGGRGPVEDDTVAVLVDQFVGQGDSRPDSLTFNAVRRVAGAEGWTSRDGKICSDWGCVRVYLVSGPVASRSDIDTATRVAEGVMPKRVAPSPTTLVPTIRYERWDLEAGFSLDYPAGWVVSDEPLSDLIEPPEVVSIGSYDLRPGGRTRQGFDAVIPDALDQLGPEDVFITLQEHERAWSVPPRPSTFSPEAVCSDPRCVDGLALGFEGMRAWWFSFQEPASGRTFSTLVAMGEVAFADPARLGAAWEVMDSLRFDGSSGPLIFPVPALGDYDFIPSDGGGSRIWPRSGSAEIGVRYRFEVGHCGLLHITDFDGSFWEPVGRSPLGPDAKKALFNMDQGMIRMWDANHALYTTSTAQEIGLLRIEGPIVPGGCF